MLFCRCLTSEQKEFNRIYIMLDRLYEEYINGNWRNVEFNALLNSMNFVVENALIKFEEELNHDINS